MIIKEEVIKRNNMELDNKEEIFNISKESNLKLKDIDYVFIHGITPITELKNYNKYHCIIKSTSSHSSGLTDSDEDILKYKELGDDRLKGINIDEISIEDLKEKVNSFVNNFINDYQRRDNNKKK